MRLHTDKLTRELIRDTMRAEQAAGRIAATVDFKTLSEHGSRTHARAFEVQLESYDKIEGDGRRAGNSGSYGAMRPDVDGYAATYDEWGWLMGALYRLDPAAVWGSVKNPQYADSEHFDSMTGWTYNPSRLLPELEADVDPYPYKSGYHNGNVGRRGAGRIHFDDPRGPRYGKLAARSVADYKKFAHLPA